ncbi:MAG: MFS transporter [Kiritimatiellia bacterium]
MKILNFPSPPRSSAPRPSHRIASTASIFSLFVFALSANALPAILLRASTDLSVDFTTLTQVSALQFTGFLIAAISGGIIADHVGKKRVLLTASGLLFAGAVTWSVAGNFLAACIGGVLMGLGGGVLESMSSTVLSDLFPDRRKFFLNLSQAFYCLGAILGPAIMSTLLPLGVSWRVCFMGVAASAFVLLVLYSKSTLPVPAPSERIQPSAVKALLKESSFILPCAALFCYVLTESAVVIYANAYLQTVHNAPEDWAIASLSLFWFAMMLGRWACTKIPEHASYGTGTAALLIAGAGMLIFQQWAESWQASLILFSLTGLTFSGIWPLIIGMSASLNPAYSGTVLGTTIAVGSLGCIMAPSLLTGLLEFVAEKNVFPLMATPLLTGAFIVLLVTHRSRKIICPPC